MITNAVDDKKWKDVSVLFDDGDFSVIWGKFSENNSIDEPYMGMRWNGKGDKVGYPQFSFNPRWLVIPDSISILVLKGLKDLGLNEPKNKNIHLKEIDKALNEYNEYYE